MIQRGQGRVLERKGVPDDQLVEVFKHLVID